MNIKFWGVRGSVPTPLTPAEVEIKIKRAFEAGERGESFDALDFSERTTFGGNTTCVEVNVGSELFILDMGTGAREMGKQQLKTIFQTKQLKGTILQSHCHWDHIQGFPFWAPLYLPRRQFLCNFNFYGGKQWDSKLDQVYRGQMDAPYFPVDLQELEQTAMNMNFHSIYDGWVQTRPNVSVVARKLFHPQETFGYRLSSGNKSIAFTTDHEPYADGLPRGLLELVAGADVWITDCQYTHDEYVGSNGPQKMGWGHSFPEYIATVAREAKPKLIITTHHDPDSNDKRIIQLARQVESGSNIETKPAHEGMSLSLSAE